MRQVINTTSVRKYTFPLLLVFISILLGFLGNSYNEKMNIKGEEIRKSDLATGLLNESEKVTQVSDMNPNNLNGASKEESNNTSFKLSIHASSNSTSESGSSSVSLDTRVNGRELGNVFDECLEKGEVNINKDGTEVECEFENGSLSVDFESDYDKSSKNETKNDSNFNVKYNLN